MIIQTKNDDHVSIFRIGNLIKLRDTLRNRNKKRTLLRCQQLDTTLKSFVFFSYRSLSSEFFMQSIPLFIYFHLLCVLFINE